MSKVCHYHCNLSSVPHSYLSVLRQAYLESWAGVWPAVGLCWGGALPQHPSDEHLQTRAPAGLQTVPPESWPTGPALSTGDDATTTKAAIFNHHVSHFCLQTLRALSYHTKYRFKLNLLGSPQCTAGCFKATFLWKLHLLRVADGVL